MAYTFTPYDVLQVLRGGEWLDYSTIRTAEESEIAIRHVMNDGRDYGQDAAFRITNGRDTIKLEKPPTAAQEAAATHTPEEALRLIQLAMDGTEWDSETTSTIAGIMAAAGYPVRDCTGDDHQDDEE